MQRVAVPVPDAAPVQCFIRFTRMGPHGDAAPRLRRPRPRTATRCVPAFAFAFAFAAAAIVYSCIVAENTTRRPCTTRRELRRACRLVVALSVVSTPVPSRSTLRRARKRRGSRFSKRVFQDVLSVLGEATPIIRGPIASSRSHFFFRYSMNL